jgi:hypothetical protein
MDVDAFQENKGIYEGETKMDASHVGLDRAVAFLLGGVSLDGSEHAHLLCCPQCRLAMLRAATEEMQKRQTGSRLGRDPENTTAPGRDLILRKAQS